jgi:hypothetical protein
LNDRVIPFFNAYMLIDLNGTYYHYCEIDDAPVTALRTAPSMGAILQRLDKGPLRLPLAPSAGLLVQ